MCHQKILLLIKKKRNDWDDLLVSKKIVVNLLQDVEQIVHDKRVVLIIHHEGVVQVLMLRWVLPCLIDTSYIYKLANGIK